MIDKLPIYNIINYLRRSRRDVEREKRTGEDTLTEQKKLMDKILDGYGVPYTQKFEIGSGDKIFSRPIFKQILDDLKNSKYDAIAVKEISRLGRGSMSDMGDIYDTIVGEYTGKKIYIITPHRIYDPNNASDLRQIRFEMFFAREEFETTRERLVGARHSSAMEGKWMGVVPFGYKRNKSTMFLNPIEEEAKIVRFIFQLYTEGLNGRKVRDRAIASHLSKIGIRTPRGKNNWYPSQVKRMLVNHAYIGTSKFRTTKKMMDGSTIIRPKEEHIYVEEAHEAIIQKDVFHKAQEIRKGNATSRSSLSAPIYELTGLIKCSKCDKKMTINSFTRSKKSGQTYQDAYVKCSHGCTTVKYNNVENKIQTFLSHLGNISEDELFEYYRQSTETSSPETFFSSHDVLKSLESKKAYLGKKLSFIQEKHFNGIYSDEDYLMFKNNVEKELYEVEETMKQNKNVGSGKEEFIPESKIHDSKKRIKSIHALYSSDITPEKRNEVLHNLINDISITVNEKGSKNKEARLTLDITLKKSFWNSKLIDE